MAVVFIGLSLKEKVYTLLQEEMIKSINSTEPGIMKTWNLIQREVTIWFDFKIYQKFFLTLFKQKFECCGFMAPYDWQKRGIFYPNSCCKYDLRCPSDENPLFAQGCYELLSKWVSDNLTIMSIVAFVISIFQIFGTTFSCLLAKSIKKGYEIVE